MITVNYVSVIILLKQKKYINSLKLLKRFIFNF